VLQPFSKNPTTKNVKKNPTLEQWRQKAPISNKKNHTMGKSEDFFIHSSNEKLIAVQPKVKGLEDREEGCNTPKKKLIFDLLGRSDGKSQRKWANANPFETLSEEVGALGFLKKTLESLEEGWTFQGKKKHKIKITTSRLATSHPSKLDDLPSKVLGEKKVKNNRSSTTPFLNP
jgi:hypothetical protein